MPIQNTTNLSNAVRAKYDGMYLRALMARRVYDMYAVGIGETLKRLEQGDWLASSYIYNFLSDMTPATSAISQSVDIIPQVLRDATGSITPTSRADALQWAEALDLQAYTDYGVARFEAIGKNEMESIDLLAQSAALTGGLVKRPAARASLDAGTSGHRFTDTAIAQMGARVKALKCPTFDNGNLMVTVHTDAFYDLIQGGNVVTIAQQVRPEILQTQSLGKWGDFTINATAWAKVFGAAGADNASSVATTLGSAANALATSVVVASATNIVAGMQLTLGTEETGDTHYATNEIVFVDDSYTSGTTIPVIGEGANGGLRFDHSSGAGVRNADNAYPAVFGGKASLVKVFANEIGEFGSAPILKESGVVNQFSTLGWKFYGGYGLIADNYIARSEYSSSLQA
jgi:hypothetical protein